MNDQEINHLIATKINGWTHTEGIVYLDTNDAYCYLADYCNSIAHALDLAKERRIALKPEAEGWQAYRLDDETVTVTDSNASKAICLCIIKMFDDTQAVEATPEASN